MATNEIRNRLSDLRDGKISLDEFQEWFDPYVWNIHKREDSETQSLAYEIGLKLAEYSSGDLDEPALMRGLVAAIRPFASTGIVSVEWVQARGPVQRFLDVGWIRKPADREAVFGTGTNNNAVGVWLPARVGKSSISPRCLSLPAA